MPRPKNEELKDAIFTVCGQLESKPTSTAVATAFARMGVESPSDRQIRRYLEEWHRLSEGEQRAYGFAHWPDVCELGLLPWDSGTALFELWRHLKRRPAVRLAQEFWHVTCASGPDASVTARHGMAVRLLFYSREPVEAALANGDYSEFEEAPFFPSSVPDIANGIALTRWETVAGQLTEKERSMIGRGLAGFASFQKWHEENPE